MFSSECLVPDKYDDDFDWFRRHYLGCVYSRMNRLALNMYAHCEINNK